MEFEKAYLYLFNGITDITRNIEKDNKEKMNAQTECILLMLKQMQLKAENLLISKEE